MFNYKDDTVSRKILHHRIKEALEISEKIYNKYDKKMTITSTYDGKHMKKSLHYVGQAVDIRTRNLKSGEQKLIIEKIQMALLVKSPFYQAILEKDHIHIEYDRRTP